MGQASFRLRVFLLLTVAVLALGTVGFSLTEGLSPGDALYFSLVTVATVGYGDIHPATPVGKGLAIVLIVAGVGTFLGVIASATEIMLNRREQTLRDQKLNMVSGLFFSEIGNRLLADFSRCDRNPDTTKAALVVSGNWSEKDFSAASQRLTHYDYSIDPEKLDLERLRNFLGRQKDLLLRLLENPVLLESESFTKLLRAIFHLKDELMHREDLAHLLSSDVAHLAGDVRRVYALLVRHWLDYMKYLKENYPYLFSLAMRTNPFDDTATATVR
ncbi:MAG: potassium channel family protein [Thermodesulfobacteriota bacterium]|nr:potassium channel family protein [Thermodesulfobacteriota bacterium]